MTFRPALWERAVCCERQKNASALPLAARVRARVYIYVRLNRTQSEIERIKRSKKKRKQKKRPRQARRTHIHRKKGGIFSRETNSQRDQPDAPVHAYGREACRILFEKNNCAHRKIWPCNLAFDRNKHCLTQFSVQGGRAGGRPARRDATRRRKPLPPSRQAVAKGMLRGEKRSSAILRSWCHRRRRLPPTASLSAFAWQGNPKHDARGPRRNSCFLLHFRDSRESSRADFSTCIRER